MSWTGDDRLVKIFASPPGRTPYGRASGSQSLRLVEKLDLGQNRTFFKGLTMATKNNENMLGGDAYG